MPARDQRDTQPRLQASRRSALLSAVAGGSMTITDACEQAGVSVRTFYRWQRGHGPGRACTPLAQRLDCVEAVESGRVSIVDACQLYGISTRTYYRWLAQKERIIELTSGSADRVKGETLISALDANDGHDVNNRIDALEGQALDHSSANDHPSLGHGDPAGANEIIGPELSQQLTQNEVQKDPQTREGCRDTAMNEHETAPAASEGFAAASLVAGATHISPDVYDQPRLQTGALISTSVTYVPAAEMESTNPQGVPVPNRKPLELREAAIMPDVGTSGDMSARDGNDVGGAAVRMVAPLESAHSQRLRRVGKILKDDQGTSWKRRIVVSDGSSEFSLVWYRGTLAKDIKDALTRRFRIPKGTFFTLRDYFGHECNVSQTLRSGSYELVL